MNVFYLHGFVSSPVGGKAQLFAERREPLRQELGLPAVRRRREAMQVEHMHGYNMPWQPGRQRQGISAAPSVL